MPVLGPVAEGQIFRVSFLQRLYAQRILNVLFYRLTDVPDVDPPDVWDYMASLADAMTGAGNIQIRMQACQTDDLSHEEIRVNMPTIPGDIVTPYFSLAAPGNGTIAAAAGTANVAESLQKRSLFDEGKPHQGNGRLQLAGVPNDTYTAGEFTAGYLEVLGLLAEAMEEAIVTAGVTAVPCNFGWDYAVPGGQPTGYHTHDIFQVVPKGTTRIMRRRTVGVGE